MPPISIRPAKDVDLEGFLDLAKEIGNVPGVWSTIPSYPVNMPNRLFTVKSKE